MAILLGLAVALVYGAADFLGGRTSRGNHPSVVVAVSQMAAVGLLAILLLVDRSPVAGARSLGFGAASGVVGLAGVLLLYRGLALGRMGVIAPVTAVGAAVVPVGYGLAIGERPSASALVGVVLALLAIGLVASSVPADVPTGGPVQRTSLGELGLAAAAGTAFGVAFVFLAESGEGSGFWPLVAARAASVPVIVVGVLVTGRALRVAPGTRLAVVVAGLLDVTAVALYLVASRRGLISLVAVLGSLYPAATVVLARVVLGERLVPVQVVGLGLALVGVALIAV